jgi:hypothetical protein
MDRVGQLRDYLAGQERRRRRWLALDRLLAAGAVAAVLLLLFVAVDAAWALPRWAVALAGAAVAAALAGGVATALLGLCRHESAAATARRLELAAPPALPANLLINSLQLAAADDLAGPAVAERLLAAAEWRALAPPLLPPGRLRRTGGLALAALLVLALAWTVAPATVGRSLARLVQPGRVVPVAGRLTLQAVQPGDAIVRPGDSLAVTVEVWGEERLLADGVRLEVRGVNRADPPLLPAFTPTGQLWRGGAAGGAAAALRLHRGEVRIPQIFQPCEYRVRAGRDSTGWHQVRVATPPALAGWAAEVAPPAYLKLKPYPLRPRGEAAAGGTVPVGSKVRLRLAADQPLAGAELLLARTAVADAPATIQGKAAEFAFTATRPGAVAAALRGAGGLAATLPLPWSVVPDAPPRVQLQEVPARQTLPAHGVAALPFQARDDAGLALTGVEAILEGATEWRTVETRPVPAGARLLNGRHLVPLASLGLKPGQRASLRVFAQDARPGAERARGWSRIVEVRLEEAEAVAEVKQKAAAAAQATLAALIQQQTENLRNTGQLLARAKAGDPVPNAPVQALHNVQKRIRGQAQELLRQPAGLGEAALALGELEKKEMPAAIQLLGEAAAGGAALRLRKLDASQAPQRLILAKLQGTQVAALQEAAHGQRRDLFSLYRQLCGGQKANLEATQSLIAGKAPAEVRPAALARAEDALAAQLSSFLDLAATAIQAEAASVEDGFADVAKKVRDHLQARATYEGMVLAAEALEQVELAPAAARQKEILKTLLEGLDLLNRWNVKSARELVGTAEEKLKDMANLLADLEKEQRGIVEATRELARKQQGGKPDAETREKLKEMDKRQEAMKELLEKFANDLFQFPELPVSGEINGKMREILEDVQQALDSANAPSMEIAVQKEDALLDAIRATKDRIQDVEMWLPDVPDNIVWNMESFDTDEMPDIPLVPLPDTLEDIVGDLLEQAQGIEAQSQDTTGNNLIADMEMGWAIMDGPMPSFAAKGKSGNMRPNDNEMTGRSGAGREGQATGEVVEKSVKGLEGRETGVRFTKDPLQSGQLEEAEDSTLDARATGGGKLGGESESIGLFGLAPRRDLGLGDHAGKVTTLRRETEALYTQARLLYLESGSLAQAAQGLRTMEGLDRPAYGSLGRKVIRHLQGSQVELAAGTALPMAVQETTAEAAGRNVFDLDLSQIKDETYRDLVRAFFERLGQPAAPEAVKIPNRQ